MHKSNLLVFMCVCLLAKIHTAPVTNIQYTCNEGTLLKYQPGYEYFYDYSTKTSLWINDVSEESKSNMELKARVVLRAIDKCLFMLRIEEPKLESESVKSDTSVLENLTNFGVQFRINSDGELDPILDFAEGDSAASRNIKRGIISAFQLKSVKDLRSIEGRTEKSAVVYETDVLGRCRTTYSTKNDANSAEITFSKKKSLSRCTLNENSKTSAIQYQPYKNLPEFNQGKLFVEQYEGESTVKAGIVDSIETEEKSTYKIGSRGTKGVQAIVTQKIEFDSKRGGYNKMSYGSFTDSQDITFEFSDKSVDDLEFKSLDAGKFMSDLCQRTSDKQGLEDEHANKFRALVNQLESYTEANLLKFYQDSKKKCQMAGITAANALIFTNTDESVKAVLSLLDNNELASTQYITEFPVLTALARNQDVSLSLLQKLKAYVQGKDTSFVYLRKLYLVYSSLVKSYCKKNDCDQATLDDLSGFISGNLGSDCSDASKKELVTVSLKAIGNVGYAKDNGILSKCAKNKQNSMEVRVSALQAFRRMACPQIRQQPAITEILRDAEEDSELRITAFQQLIKCNDDEQFERSAKDYIPKFLENEKNLQVLTYIVDYAKEHGITLILNPILNNPRLKEKFSVNFKQISWNNFRYKYSIIRDGAFEMDTSVIFDTKKAFLPRSIRVNVTTHLYGMSINFLDLTVRMEGMDEILRWAIIEKLRSADIIKRLQQQPETLIDILQSIADKLKYTSEKPYMSILLRIYGSDVFYSELDNADKLKKLAEFIRSPRDKLVYSDVDMIRNMLLIDSRVRQPLANGFEFNTFMDMSLGLFINKESKKTDSEGKRVFQVNNFYSASLAINKRFEVQLSKLNRLALKKKAVLNTQFNVDLQGSKTNNTHSYTINLRPQSELKLASFEGKFFKLGSDSQYSEVTQFSVDQRVLDKCTSDNFKLSTGVQLCLSVKRPKVFSLRQLALPETSPINEDDDDDDDDDDDEEDDDNNNTKDVLDIDEDDDEDDEDEDDNVDKKFARPRLTLSGPYSYVITLKNPDMVKSLIVNGKFEREQRRVSYNAKLQTKSASNQIQTRLELNYLRQRNFTNLAMDRSINLEIKRGSDTRLKFLAKIEFIKDQLLHLNLNIDNKILRDLDLNLEFKREKKEDDLAPLYKIEALLDSKLRRTPKYRKLSINLKPDGRDIEGDIIIEYSGARTNEQLKKVIDGKMKLSSNKDDAIDYDVDVTINTQVPSKTRLYGKVAWSQLESNVDLSLDHDGNRLDLPEPANLKLGHEVDASGTVAKIQLFAQLKAALPNRKINHGGRIVLEANPLSMRPSYLEVHVNTPKTVENGNLPYIVLIGKRVSNEATEYLLGMRNFNIDLSSRAESGLGRALVRVDNNNILKSLVASYKRVRDESGKKLTATISIRKNDASLANIETQYIGSLKDLKENAAEVPKQDLGLAFSAKVLDYAGSIEAKATLESSVSRGVHSVSLNVKTDNFLRIMLKVGSIKWNMDVKPAQNQISGEFEIQKLGEVKSWKLKTTNGQLRSTGDGVKEFDITYEKNLANGNKLTDSGTVQYAFDDAKNWEASSEMEKFRFKISLSNQRESNNAAIGEHDVHIQYAHLDVSREEREFKLELSNKTDAKTNLKQFVINVLARKGVPDQLDDTSSLHYLFDLKTDHTFLGVSSQDNTLVEGKNSFAAKSKQFNVDVKLSSNAKLDARNQKFNWEWESALKFPAIISDPGKLNSLDEKISFNWDLASQRRTLKANIKTDNKLIGKYFKVLDLDYVRSVAVSGINVNQTIDIDVDVTTADDQAKKLNAKIERFSCREDADDTCQGTRVSLKQDLMPEYKRRLSEGSIDIKDCKLETKLARVKSEARYLLEVSKFLQCSGEDILNNGLKISREHETKTTEVKLLLDSDMLYPKRGIELAHRKFNKKDGLLRLAVATSETNFASKFSYERQLNETTSKLLKGTYKLETSFGDKATKSCELNIESKTNYYNRLSCSIKTPRLPVKLNYGYSLKVNNQQELLFGKRDIELELTLPSTRVLRAEYKATRAVQVKAIDVSKPEEEDDDNDNIDEEHESEFDAALTYYWDYSKAPSKFVKITAKRDNYAVGATKTTLNFLNYPRLKLFQVQVERKRSFNQTEIDIDLSYETDTGAKNRLSIDTLLHSDMDNIGIDIETSLERPKFNVLYASRFDRSNGRLQFLEVRLAKLIKLRIDKEADPENRRISVELVNPSDAYTVSASRTDANGIYTVQSQLKKSGSQLSSLESKFDSNNNVLNVRLDEKYQLNLGVYSEKLGDFSVTDLKANKQLALGTLRVFDQDDEDYLELKLRWNRFWVDVQREILNNQDMDNTVQPNPNFKSFLGDVLSKVTLELKPGYDAMAEERKPVKEDLKKFALLLLDHYSNLIPAEKRAQLTALFQQKLENYKKEQEEINSKPFLKRVYVRYNDAAEALHKLYLRLRRVSKRLGRFVPKLPRIEYSSVSENPEQKLDNQVTITRATRHAENLYQANAIYRNGIRRLAERFLSAKGNLARNTKSYTFRGLINKYKYRSLDSYTMVGAIFNRRAIIQFNGNSKILATRCKYLLTHELAKNKFSVILNNNEREGILGVTAFGQPLIEISGESAFMEGKKLPLPYKFEDKATGEKFVVHRLARGVSFEAEGEFMAACYADSKTCVVGLTRFSVGKVNGLLGSSNYETDRNAESYWYLEKTCKAGNLQLKEPSNEAVRACYLAFGRHRKALFKDAFEHVKPIGWQKICETSLTYDIKNKCPIMKAFERYTQVKKVDITVPSECHQCKAQDKTYLVGQSLANAQNVVEQSNDYVFILLPCDYSKNLNELISNMQKITSSIATNNYYLVSADEMGPSLVQNEAGQTRNIDIAKALQTISAARTSDRLEKSDLYKAMFIGARQFGQRLAQNRHMVILSCGNCIDYDMIAAMRVDKVLKARNIVVSAWGKYPMNDKDGALDNQTPVGYGYEKIFLRNGQSEDIDMDSLEGYRVEHNQDLCNRLAVKTGGAVFDVGQIKNARLFQNVMAKLREARPVYDYKINKCEMIRTPYGDMADFSYKRIAKNQNSDDDEDDDVEDDDN